MNQKLVEMLARRLVSLLMNCSKKTITNAVLQGRFSFYSLISISTESLDYRFFCE